MKVTSVKDLLCKRFDARETRRSQSPLICEEIQGIKKVNFGSKKNLRVFESQIQIWRMLDCWLDEPVAGIESLDQPF